MRQLDVLHVELLHGEHVISIQLAFQHTHPDNSISQVVLFCDILFRPKIFEHFEDSRRDIQLEKSHVHVLFLHYTTVTLACLHENTLLLNSDSEFCGQSQRRAGCPTCRNETLMKSDDELILVSYELLGRIFHFLSHHDIFETLSPNSTLCL